MGGPGDSEIQFKDGSFEFDPSAYQKEGYIFLGCYDGQTTDSRLLINHKGVSLVSNEEDVPSTIYALYEKIEDIMCFTYKADNFKVGSQSKKTAEFSTHPALADYLATKSVYAFVDMNFLHFEHVADIAGVGFYNFTNYKIIANEQTLNEGSLRSSYKSMTFTQLVETTTQDIAKGLSLQITSPDSNYSTESAEYTNLVAKVYFGEDKDKILEEHQYDNLGGYPMKFNVQNPSMVVNMGAPNDNVDFTLPWNAVKRLSGETDKIEIKYAIENYGRKLLLASNWAYIKFTAYDELGNVLATGPETKLENNGGVATTSGSFKIENPSELRRLGIQFYRTSGNVSTMFYYVHSIALTIGSTAKS